MKKVNLQITVDMDLVHKIELRKQLGLKINVSKICSDSIRTFLSDSETKENELTLTIEKTKSHLETLEKEHSETLTAKVEITEFLKSDDFKLYLERVGSDSAKIPGVISLIKSKHGLVLTEQMVMSAILNMDSDPQLDIKNRNASSKYPSAGPPPVQSGSGSSVNTPLIMTEEQKRDIVERKKQEWLTQNAHKIVETKLAMEERIQLRELEALERKKALLITHTPTPTPTHLYEIEDDPEDDQLADPDSQLCADQQPEQEPESSERKSVRVFEGV